MAERRVNGQTSLDGVRFWCRVIVCSPTNMCFLFQNQLLCFVFYSARIGVSWSNWISFEVFFFVFLVAGEHHDANFVFSTTTSTEIPKKCLDGPFINPSLLCAKSLSAAAYRMKRFMVFSKVGNIHGILQNWRIPMIFSYDKQPQTVKFSTSLLPCVALQQQHPHVLQRGRANTIT